MCVNPLVYSFIAGAAVSLAGNVYCSSRITPTQGLAASKPNLYAAAALLTISGTCLFFVGVKLDAIRATQLSMKNPPDPNDLILLLSEPSNSRLIRQTLLLALVTLVVAFICLSLRR
jgi:hypothetical protein